MLSEKGCDTYDIKGRKYFAEPISCKKTDVERASAIFSKTSFILVVLTGLLQGVAGEKIITKDPVEDFQTGWTPTGCTAHYNCLNEGVREPNTPNTADYIEAGANSGLIDEHGISALKPNTFNWIALKFYADLSNRGSGIDTEIRNGTTIVASQRYTTDTIQWFALNWTAPSSPTDLRGWFQPYKGGGPNGQTFVDSWYMEISYNDSKPQWRNQSQNVSKPTSGEAVKLYSEGFDDLNLSNASLATNESGSWENKTGVYGSPITDIGTSDTYTWTNFTWSNGSIRDRIVGWRIYYRDSGVYYNDSRINSTDIQTFNVSSPKIGSPEFNYDPIEAGVELNVTLNASAPSRQNIDTVLVNLTDASGNIEVLNAVMEKDSAVTDQFFFNRTLINETSNIGQWTVNVSVNNSLGVRSENGSFLDVLEKKPPEWRNQQQSKLDVDTGSTNFLSAEGFDNFKLERGILATNETGKWDNKTANYASPKEIGTTQVWSRTEFSWSNNSVNNTKVAWKIWYEDNLSQYTPTDTKEFYVNGQDMNVTDLFLNKSNIVEGKKIGVVSNVSNIGTGKVIDSEINLTIETYNGTWEKTQELNKTVNIGENDREFYNFTWTAKPGSYRFSVEADPANTISEINETNNRRKLTRNVSSHHIFYGGNSATVSLSDQNSEFVSWFSTGINSTLFFSDTDIDYTFSDLMPLNHSNDLTEADKDLNLTGHNDSLKNLYDRNGDGVVDNTKCVKIGAQEVCEIPYINTTNTQSFQTYLLYDSGFGTPYDGSQPLIFMTRVNNSKSGKYGNYDYEIRLPYSLESQEPSTDRISIFAEI